MLNWMNSRQPTAGPTVYLSHSDCTLHNMGHDHPESPDRLAAIQDRLIASGIWDHLVHVEAPVATMEQLGRVHPSSHVEALQSMLPTHGIVHIDADTAMCPDSMRAALRAAGAVVKATDMVIDGEAANAFCAIRPPGHHAEPRAAMGFCLFNNLGIGVMHALARGIQRIAVADFDVHHGNGTEVLFHRDPRVQMVSIFQSPFYPYCGERPMGPNMHNVALKAGTRGDEFRMAVDSCWLPVLTEFKPQMIFISAGFDAHLEDDMASLGLIESDYGWVTERLVEVARTHAQGRIVSVLEGGYNLSALGRSAATHIRVLAGV